MPGDPAIAPCLDTSGLPKVIAIHEPAPTLVQADPVARGLLEALEAWTASTDRRHLRLSLLRLLAQLEEKDGR